ncbi:MAG: YbaK/EbsC family protein [Oscillospiraceae bacterium]|jgi:prolyl-tRNA editing enzyme YbaK/EbsC (Cys-tRNA(Pro) deacylase)|nr:YbaK/EbsC family protein [Oscillospiraceae bacterium]
MSYESARAYLKKWGRDKDIIVLGESIATVELAAAALGALPERIAKSIALKKDENSCLVIVAAGDVKVDNRKFKDEFGLKAKMLNYDETLAMTGHPVGGVCPFGLPETAEVYMDESLKRFDIVYPACGSRNSAIKLKLKELEEYSGLKKWVDVCKEK